MIDRSSTIRLCIFGLFVLLTAGCQKKKIETQAVKSRQSTDETIGDKYDTGLEKVNNIMMEIKHNVVPSNPEPILYADVQNIEQDINLEKIANFFGCKTVMGHTFLVETLKHPVAASDKSSIVEHRQKAVLALVKDPHLKKQIQDLVDTAAIHEQQIIQLMSDFFIGKTCPELASLALLKSQKSGFYPMVEFCNTNTTMKTVVTTLNVITILGGSLATIFTGLAAAHDAHLGLAYSELVISTAYFGFLTGLYTYVLYDDCSKAAQKRSKMHALNQLIATAESIEFICTLYNIDNQFKMSLIHDAQGIELVQKLKHCRYKNKSNYCFNAPSVHTLLYKVYKNDKHLAQMFASIAEMDVYNAIANKILEGQGSEHEFCCAQITESPKPEVLSTSFWNVLVPDAVVNDLIQDKHIILTGPNAGGKTTAIRSNLQNIILAQTYGFAAAKTFEYTPFDVIVSYLNVSDDLINGLSLFASEIKRAQELLQMIKKLDPDQKLYFALDELFTGTAAEEGEKCAYEFIKKLSSFDRILFVYATHFNKLKELAQEESKIVNYKVDAPIKNDKGKLVYPYTLSFGASDINIALDMAKEANLFE